MKHWYLALALIVPGRIQAAPRGTELNAPENCPYCGGEKERMQPAEIFSHAGFVFAHADTQHVDALISSADIFWIESRHFRFGLGIGSYRIPQAEKKGLRAELTELRKVLPEVRPKAKVLDPWLRLHLYAQRFEAAYDLFLQVMQLDPLVFPPGDGIWEQGTEYWGEGPYLGENDKYECIVFFNADQQVSFLSDQFGLQIRNTQKWNILPRGALTFASNLETDNLRRDAKLHGHLIFNHLHNFIDGFKYYAYDTPLWLNEGLAHYFERKLDPNYNSYSYTEGGQLDPISKEEWRPEVKMLVTKDKAPRVAEMNALKTFSEFSKPHHYTSWSMVTYLIEEHPEGFAALNAMLHGRKGADGHPDGARMDEVLRTSFKKSIGMSYASFDAAWRRWALRR